MIQVGTEDRKGIENDKVDLTEQVFAHKHHILLNPHYFGPINQLYWLPNWQ